jgi:hypothetical protein
MIEDKSCIEALGPLFDEVRSGIPYFDEAIKGYCVGCEQPDVAVAAHEALNDLHFVLVRLQNCIQELLDATDQHDPGA